MRKVEANIKIKATPNKKLLIKNFVYFNPEKSILRPIFLYIMVKPNGEFNHLFICQDGYLYGGDWDYEAVADAWIKALEVIKFTLNPLNKHYLQQ